jgi:hypothetical protein
MTTSSTNTSRTSSPHGTNALKTIRDIGGFVLLDEMILFCSKTSDFDISQFSSDNHTSSRSESDASRSRLEVSPPSNAKIFHWGASSKACSTFHERKSIGYWTEDSFTTPPHLIDLSPNNSPSSSSECPGSSKTSAINLSQKIDDNTDVSLSNEWDVSLGLSDDEMSVDVEECERAEKGLLRS